jgi:hypothetical protein
MASPASIAIRAALCEYVSEQARWRAEKAVEYPEDGRNATSAAALTELASYLEGLPDTDARFVTLGDSADVLFPGGDTFMPGEDAARMVSRFGFDRPRITQQPDWRPADASEYFDQLVEACVTEAAQLRRDGLLDGLADAAMSEGALDALDEFDEAEKGGKDG